MTIYLKFDTQEQAVTALTSAGYQSADGMHYHGDGLAVLFQIPEQDGFFCNIYDSETTALDAHRVPDPLTPYNRLA